MGAVEQRPVAARVACRVRALRSARKWSGAELAAEMRRYGIRWSQSVVANLESGRRPDVTVDELLALASAFGRSTEDLLFVPDDCRRCHGEPPFGFTCNTCWWTGAVIVEARPGKRRRARTSDS